MEVNFKMINKHLNFFNRNKYKKYLVSYGGAGSGKSYSTAGWLMMKMIQEKDKVFVISRKTNPSLKRTAYKIMKEMAHKFNATKLFKENKSEQMWEFDNGNVVYFLSVDDPEKIKSLEMNYVWLEEATEFTANDFDQFKLRLRRQNALPNQIFITFNPIDTMNWVYRTFFKNPIEEKVTAINKTTYLDNAFLPEDYVKTLENLKTSNYKHYLVYALGEWGSIGHKVYNNYRVISEKELLENITDGVDVTSKEIVNYFNAVVYGLDPGFVHPLALVQLGIREKTEVIKMEDKENDENYTDEEIERLKELKEKISDTKYEIYVLREFKQSYVRNEDLLEKLLSFVVDAEYSERFSTREIPYFESELDIFVDAAAQDKIAWLRDRGFNAKQSIKKVNQSTGADLGVQFLQGCDIIIVDTCKDTLSEIKGYATKTDRDGQATEKPDKKDGKDDLMDAIKYGAYTWSQTTKLETV